MILLSRRKIFKEGMVTVGLTLSVAARQVSFDCVNTFFGIPNEKIIGGSRYRCKPYPKTAVRGADLRRWMGPFFIGGNSLNLTVHQTGLYNHSKIKDFLYSLLISYQVC